MEGVKEGGEGEVTVKLRGETLKCVMGIKHEKEEGTGKPISVAEIVRGIIKERKENGR